MNKIKKYVFILLTLTINFTMLFAFIYQNFNNLKKNISYTFFNKWFLIIFFIIFLHYFLNTLIIKIFINLHKSYHFHHGLTAFLIGSFYSKIIPIFNSGEVMQTYVLNKQGVPMSIAVSLTIMRFILKKMLVFLMVFFSIIFRFNFFRQIGLNKIAYLTIISGCFINFFIIFFVFLMAFSSKIEKIVISLITKLLNRFDFKRKKNDRNNNSYDVGQQITITIENFKIELQRLLSNYKTTILIFFIIFLDLMFYYLIPLFIGMMFGRNSINNSFMFFDICILSNFHYVATDLIPIPGISEILFFYLFSKFYNNTSVLINLSQFIWRFFTFYLDLIIGGFIKIFYKVKTKNNEPIEINRKTFITIQLETFEERKKTSNDLFKTKFSNDGLQNRLKDFFSKEKKKENNNDYGLNDVDLEENSEFKNSKKRYDEKKKKKKWQNFDI